MKIVQAVNGLIKIGRQGENLVTRVQFPVASIVERYNGKEFRLAVVRPGETLPYTVELTADEDGKNVYWDVRKTDTKNAGTGRCELHYLVDETAIAKVLLYNTKIEESITETTDSWSISAANGDEVKY